MNVFKVKYENEEDGDLYAISIVDDPANGFNFIAMSEKVEIKLKKDDKRKILYGIVLRPEQQIYREFEDGTPFMLKFDADTIVKLSQDFFKKGYQSNSTYNHESDMKLSGTTVVENWIVEDKNNDKGNAIGLPVEMGDWIIGMKLSDDLWAEYIETGKAKGFSIDSFIQFEKITMSITPPFHDACKCKMVDGEIIQENGVCDYCQEQATNLIDREKNKNKNMSLIKTLIKMFSEAKLASLETENGTYTADAFEVGNVVYDSELNPFSGEFVSEGNTYKTDETGTITEITPVEEVTEEVEMEDTVDVEVATEVVDEVVEILDAPVEEIVVEELQAKVDELIAEVEKLTTENNDVLIENANLKKLVASTKLKAVTKGNPINLVKKDQSTGSALDAISRITKKNKI